MANQEEKNIFELAARKKIRFKSPRGDLTVEQLWEVPLRSKDGFDLNVVAKTANSALQAASQESFVDERVDPAQKQLDLAFKVIMHVINVKREEELRAAERANKKLEREKLLKAYAEKQDAKLGSMSEETLRKKLSELDDPPADD